VEVSRHERTVASLRQGEQQARAEAQQCRDEKARLQAEGQSINPSPEQSAIRKWRGGRR
jgi:hypothetical protein